MGSQNPHSQDRATHLSIPSRLSSTNQNPSTQGIFSSYFAWYVENREFVFKSRRDLEKAYSLSSSTLLSSDWKFTLAADPNLPKPDAYYFLCPDSSNSQVILLPQSTSTPPRVPYLRRNRIRNKRDNGGKKHMMKQMRWTESQFQTAL